MKPVLIVFLYCLNFAGVAQAPELFRTETVNDEIDIPWGIDWLPTGEMLVTERSGTLHKINDGRLITIAGTPNVVDKGQGGLLDVKVHPNYVENGLVYLSYSKAIGNGLATTAVIRGEIRGTDFVESAEVFLAEPASKTRRHYGSRIVFDRDGLMYVSVGDRGNRDENPQSLGNHCGKIHRMKDDGSVPNDNPYVGNMVAMQTIYSYGHRNPQGMAVHPVTGLVWTHEHGPKGGDEINIVAAKKNYGWPVISYGINYSGTKFTDLTAKDGMEQPLLYWVPSIAPSGMDFVSSSKYGEDLKGDLLVGSLKFSYLKRVDLEGDQVINEEEHLKGVGRVRCVRQGPDGFIYLGVEGKGVLKLLPK
ncbi:MAG: PQQ-dependent sugar dehydrogenase [Cyclobacteriaceae bacterium]|nr:PQQ-dependent sugar dehydrogenase [Cyclobacteriaceae bacterium HetDA_MAG_MS6]